MSDYNVLDLFAGLGGFSSAFADSDRWDVTTVEIEERFNPDIQADIFNLRPSDFENEFDVVLASPPCYQLSPAGNHDNWNFEHQQPTADDSKNAVALFHHTVGLIHGLAPRYHFIENPRNSRIRWTYGDPDEWVTYCQYGRHYQKPTALWGEFPPMTFKRCVNDANCHEKNTPTDGTQAIASMDNIGQAERSKVPYELSKAIRDACEAGLDGDVAEQSGLEAFA